MTGVRLLHGVHRERPDRVDREVLDRARVACGSAHASPCLDVVTSPVKRAAISCAASTPAPITPASAPPRAIDTVARFQSAGSAREAASCTARSRNRSMHAREAAADHELVRLEDVHVAGDRGAQHAREAVEEQQRVAVARARGALDDAPGDAPLGGQRAPEHAVGLVGSRARSRRARAPGRCSRPRRSRGWGSCPGTAARPARARSGPARRRGRRRRGRSSRRRSRRRRRRCRASASRGGAPAGRAPAAPRRARRSWRRCRRTRALRSACPAPRAAPHPSTGCSRSSRRCRSRTRSATAPPPRPRPAARRARSPGARWPRGRRAAPSVL